MTSDPGSPMSQPMSMRRCRSSKYSSTRRNLSCTSEADRGRGSVYVTPTRSLIHCSTSACGNSTSCLRTRRCRDRVEVRGVERNNAQESVAACPGRWRIDGSASGDRANRAVLLRETEDLQADGIFLCPFAEADLARAIECGEGLDSRLAILGSTRGAQDSTTERTHETSLEPRINRVDREPRHPSRITSAGGSG